MYAMDLVYPLSPSSEFDLANPSLCIHTLGLKSKEIILLQKVDVPSDHSFMLGNDFRSYIPLGRRFSPNHSPASKWC